MISKAEKLKEQFKSIIRQKTEEFLPDKEILKPIVMKKRFTGKTDDFSDNRERHFFQRMLRAYLKGHTHFNFGFSDQVDKFGFVSRRPDTYKVMFEYYGD